MSQRKLKIAIYAEKFPPEGGGIATAHYALYRLLKDTHEVKLFAFVDHDRPSTESTVRGRSAPVLGKILEWLLVKYVCKYSPQGDIDACRKIPHAAAVVWSMNRELLKFAPDIVIVSDDRLPLLALKNPRKSKVVWMAHHNYARFRNQPFIDGPCDYDLFLAHRLERRAVRKADHVVFVSKYMEEVFRATLSEDLPGTRIRNFLDLSDIHLTDRGKIRKEMGFQPEETVIYIPSGGTQPKGLRFVPEIVRRLRQQNQSVAFYISGPVNSLCQIEFASLPTKIKVFTPGPVSQSANLLYASACDLCVSPAIIENFSLALLEALALGLPCVTFDVGGNRELVVDQLVGHLVDFLDIDSLCDRASKLIQDKDIRMKLARAAKIRAAELCQLDSIRNQYNELFYKLVEQE